MTPIQSLYFALGEIAYAIAKSDGVIQKEERLKLHSILEEEFAKCPNETATTEIIFELLKRDNNRSKVTFDWGLNEIKLNASFLSADLKDHFIHVIQKVAEAFPPVTAEERQYIEDFFKTMNTLQTSHYN